MAKVSVLMPVHNGAPFVKEAIKSILAQTFSDFELLVTDDCSTDRTPAILDEMASTDRRIKVFRNPENRGIAQSLNQMIDTASGEYLARMDADDLALPTRFEQQCQLLDGGCVDLCGSWIKSIGKLRDRVVRFPLDDKAIRASLLFQSAFMHPSIMMRASLFSGGLRYSLDTPHAEDYDLWVRLTERCRFANLPQVLHRYRRHSEQVSEAHALTQWESASKIRLRYLHMLGIKVTAREQYVHSMIRYPTAIKDKELLREMEAWLMKLADHFSDNPRQRAIVSEQWFRVCVRSAHFGIWTWTTYRRSSLRPISPGGRLRSLDLLLISMARLRYQSRMFRVLENFSISS